MPNYEYINTENGSRLTLTRPVAERDAPVADAGGRLLPLKRVTVPASIAIAGTAPNPCDPIAGMRRGFKRLEERGELPRHMNRPDVVAHAFAQSDYVTSEDGTP